MARNEQARKVREIEDKHPGEFDKIYPLVRGELYRQSFQERGDTENSCWSCGQSIGLIDKVRLVLLPSWRYARCCIVIRPCRRADECLGSFCALRSWTHPIIAPRSYRATSSYAQWWTKPLRS